jgi:2-aminoadipate transaminase
MDSIFSDRISDVPRSFIREILKVALDRTFISFGGGLPNRALFPIEEIKAASVKVFDTFGNDVLQYANSEGSKELRELVSRRYKEKKGLDISPDRILITTGSQQGIDLLGKSLLNEGDGLVIDEPGYLGAIQAFSLYRPRFHPIPMNDEGMNITLFARLMARTKPKLMYTVPNFQNPSGISYSEATRRFIAGNISSTKTILIEDDPYGEIQFSGRPRPSFYTMIPDNTVLLGSFSKIVAPGLRLGWLVAPPALMDKILIAKQAADLHTSYFVQCVVYQYMIDNDVEKHIKRICESYGRQCRAMIESIEQFFPAGVTHSQPEGGMFLWVTMPAGASARKLLDLAVKEKVLFVPGDPFYIGKKDTNTMRLNFTCSNEEEIKVGIERLGNAMKKLLKLGNTVER